MQSTRIHFYIGINFSMSISFARGACACMDIEKFLYFSLLFVGLVNEFSSYVQQGFRSVWQKPLQSWLINREQIAFFSSLMIDWVSRFIHFQQKTVAFYCWYCGLLNGQLNTHSNRVNYCEQKKKKTLSILFHRRWWREMCTFSLSTWANWVWHTSCSLIQSIVVYILYEFSISIVIIFKRTKTGIWVAMSTMKKSLLFILSISSRDSHPFIPMPELSAMTVDCR